MDFKKINCWFKTNAIEHNASKRFQQSFTRNFKQIANHNRVDGTYLQSVTSITDSGIIIDSKVTFIPHRHLDLSVMYSITPKILIYWRHKLSNMVEVFWDNGSIVWRPLNHTLRVRRVQKRFVCRLAFDNGAA